MYNNNNTTIQFKDFLRDQKPKKSKYTKEEESENYRCILIAPRFGILNRKKS